jgi:hypothetical protein
VLEEAKWVKKTLAEIKTDAKNRVRWSIPVEAVCSVAEWWDLSINSTWQENFNHPNVSHLMSHPKTTMSCQPHVHLTLSGTSCSNTVKLYLLN